MLFLFFCILEHSDDCNTQINIGEGENHTSVSRFVTSIVAYERGKNPRYYIQCFANFCKLMFTIHTSRISTFQSEYCQCFTFKRCNKIPPIFRLTPKLSKRRGYD